MGPIGPRNVSTYRYTWSRTALRGPAGKASAGREKPTMTHRAPCYRHRRRTWIASCADCTAWHLAALTARSDELTDTESDAGRRPGSSGTRAAVLAAA